MIKFLAFFDFSLLSLRRMQIIRHKYIQYGFLLLAIINISTALSCVEILASEHFCIEHFHTESGDINECIEAEDKINDWNEKERIKNDITLFSNGNTYLFYYDYSHSENHTPPPEKA